MELMDFLEVYAKEASAFQVRCASSNNSSVKNVLVFNDLELS